MEKTLPELYLEKRDELTDRERDAILTAIEWMNKPAVNITSKDAGFIAKDNIISLALYIALPLAVAILVFDTIGGPDFVLWLASKL